MLPRYLSNLVNVHHLIVASSNTHIDILSKTAFEAQIQDAHIAVSISTTCVFSVSTTYTTTFKIDSKKL